MSLFPPVSVSEWAAGVIGAREYVVVVDCADACFVERMDAETLAVRIGQIFPYAPPRARGLLRPRSVPSVAAAELADGVLFHNPQRRSVRTFNERATRLLGGEVYGPAVFVCGTEESGQRLCEDVGEGDARGVAGTLLSIANGRLERAFGGGG